MASPSDADLDHDDADHEALVGVIRAEGAFMGSPAVNTATYELADAILAAGFTRANPGQEK